MKLGLIVATKEGASDGYNIFEHLGIGYVAAAVEENLPQVEVLLFETLAELLAAKPDIIGISSVTEDYYNAISYATQIKKTLNTPIILGGVHISLLPLSLKPCFDIAVIGEGERTIVELLQSYLRYDGFILGKLKNIPGLFFYHNEKPVSTHKRKFIENLDTISCIKRSRLPYWRGRERTYVFTARGCPYNCLFCASTRIFPTYRSRSPENIIQEIKSLVEDYGIKEIMLFDDLLISSKKIFRELVHQFEKSGLSKSIVTQCQVRANVIDAENCDLLKRLNVSEVGIGLESFSDDILKYYNKKAISANTNQNALDLLHQYGIKCSPSLIFGAPIETRDDMLKTFRAIYKNLQNGSIHRFGWGLLRPYPGTGIWEIAAQKNIVSSDMDWNIFKDWSSQKLYLGEKVTRQEFQELTDEWFTKFSMIKEDWGNGCISDKPSLEKKILALQPLIKNRHSEKKPEEPGDDSILNYNQGDYATQSDKVVFSSGFHDDEGGWRWLAKEGEILIPASGTPSKLSFQISCSEKENYQNFPFKLNIYTNDHLISELLFDKTEQSHFVSFQLNEQKDTQVRLKSEECFVPADLGTSQDPRCLSVILTNFQISSS